MRRSFVLLFLTLLLQTSGASQNLVPNPGFDEFNFCPPGITFSSQDIENFPNMIPPWFMPTRGTVDYYNECGGPAVKVPDNWLLSQQPKNGTGYVGLYAYAEGYHYREYIRAKLKEPLELCETYDVSFYVNLTEGSYFSTDKFGIYFSIGNLTFPDSAYLIHVTPQIENEEGKFLSSTTDWTLISGVLKADQPYDYITIGNFYPDDSIHYLAEDTGTSADHMSYYLVDEISITKKKKMIQKDSIYNICVNEPLAIVAQSPNKSVKWYHNNILIADTDSINFLPKGSDTLKAVVDFNCIITDTTYNYLLKPKPITSFTLGNDSILWEGSSINLFGPSNANNFIWSNNDSTKDIIVNEPGSYWLKVKYLNGCSYSDTINLDCCAPEILLIPNLFTPNGDSINDYFFPVWKDVKEYNIQIFNRWGERVFYTDNNNSDYWYGKETSDGVYFYEIKYRGYYSDWDSAKGWVHLIR